MAQELVAAFFARSTYCSPEVICRIADDLTSVVRAFQLSPQVTVWGSTQQERLCIFGVLRIQQEGVEKPLPIQLWLAHLYPVEPPVMYVVAPKVCMGSDDANCSELVPVRPRVVKGHPNVDHTGVCFCTSLSEWCPRTSSILMLLKTFVDEIQRNGFPIVLERGSVPAGEPISLHERGGHTDCVICYNKCSTVFVPCGHLCCCSSCGANVSECPICREPISVRQVIVL